jgi:N6-adenosine-specific RNA methylase IME4
MTDIQPTPAPRMRDTTMLDLPQVGRYAMIAADPPWHVEMHYPTMSFAEIEALPVRDLAAPDAHCLLWITGPMLTQGRHLPILSAWGFRPSSIAFTWVKLKRSIDARQLRLTVTQESDLHVGLGLTTRKNAEFCVLGRRGNAKRVSKSVREIILAPVREHSRKPDEFYRRAMAYAAGPYVELFSREPRPGWDAWGAETEKFAPRREAA